MTMVLMDAIAGGGAAARTSTRGMSMFSCGGSMGNATTAKTGTGKSTVMGEDVDLAVAKPVSIFTGVSSQGLGFSDSGSFGCPHGLAHWLGSSGAQPPHSRCVVPSESRHCTSPPATAWKPVVSMQMTAMRRWRNWRVIGWWENRLLRSNRADTAIHQFNRQSSEIGCTIWITLGRGGILPQPQAVEYHADAAKRHRGARDDR